MKLLLTAIGMLLLHNATNAQDFLKQGDACYTQKNYACAYDNYMKGQEANLPSVKNILYFRIGFCLNSLKRYEEAKVWLWRALKEKVELDPTWSLAAAHYNTFKYDSAAIYYMRANGLATTPEHKKSTSYYAGLSYYLGKNYTGAIAQFNATLKLDTTDINTHTYIGRSYFSVKNYQAAETAFRKLLSLSKDSGSVSYAHKMIGETMYNQLKYAQAIPSYRTALQFKPKDRYLVGYLADCYYHLNKMDSAKLTYQQAIDMVKNEKGSYYEDSLFIGDMSHGLLNSYAKEKDTANAIRKLADIVKYDIESENLTSLLDLLVFKRKDIKTLEGMMPSLITGYKAFGMKSELAWLYNNAAIMYEGLKQQPKALSNYRLAVQTNYPPTDYIGGGFIKSLITEKKYKEATDSINKWETITHPYPNLFKPVLLNMKGRIAYAQNDTATAAKYFKEVIKTNYTSHDA